MPARIESAQLRTRPLQACGHNPKSAPVRWWGQGLASLCFFPALGSCSPHNCSELTRSSPRPGPFLPFPAWQMLISAPSLQVGASADGPWCQETSGGSYISLVISGGWRWTFAQSTLPRQEQGYKTPGPVSCCHWGENLSGLRVPSDWIIMNNEWGFMLHWSINKMGVTGRHSGHRKHPGPPGGQPPSRWPRRIWGLGVGSGPPHWQSPARRLWPSPWVAGRDQDAVCPPCSGRCSEFQHPLQIKIWRCYANHLIYYHSSARYSVETEALWETSRA